MNISNFNEYEKKQIYITTMRPVLNKRALFSDATAGYLQPMEPEVGDEVTVYFRTGRDNVDEVIIITDAGNYKMEKFKSEGAFDYYRGKFQVGEKTVRYYFDVHSGNLNCYFNKLGVTKHIEPYYAFSIYPGFHTPDWAKGAVIYQIFVDRFCNGDKTNDVVDREYNYIGDNVVQVKDWYQYPSSMDVRSFYGGDLQGVWNKLDYLQNLGVEVIYFNPLFVSPSNHKYDSQDYDYIDPHYGKIVSDGGEPLPEGEYDNSKATKYIKRVTDKANLEASNQFFAELVEEIHKRGMKVILDGVFNHCGSFNKWMDKERIYEKEEGYEKGAYVDKESPYNSFFSFHEDRWPYNHTYDGWWGHDTLPKLNYEGSEKLYEYIMNIAKKWVSPPYNVDGWRLDVAADLGHSGEFNHKFWKDFRKAVKSANPNAIILAEHYGNPNEWLQGDEWDTVMNYDAFMEPLTWFFTGMEKHSDSREEGLYGNADSFIGAMKHHMASFATPSLQVAMNELSNHDHSRFLTRTNHKVGRINTLGPEAANEGINKAVLREAVIMQMTWPGAPTLYYGDEAGLCGFTDPDNRRTFPWGREDHELIDFHREAIRMHKRNSCLKYGSLKFLGADYQYIAYGRFDNEQQIAIAFNNLDSARHVEIPVWELGVPMECNIKRIMFSTDSYYSIGRVDYLVHNGVVSVELPAFSGIVLRHRNKDDIKE